MPTNILRYGLIDTYKCIFTNQMVMIKMTTITITAIITIAIPTIAPVESSSDDSLGVVAVTVVFTAKQHRE